MALQSMTGFATVDGEAGATRYTFDARSVNGRSLDVRLRLPPGLERHEVALRKRVGERFKRGSITLSLTTQRRENVTEYTVNERQLRSYLDVIHSLAASGSVAAPRADGLLALRGVIEAAEPDDGDSLAAEVMPAADRLLERLAEARRGEGERIAPLIREQLSTMERLGAAIDAHPERSAETIKAKLDRQIAELAGGSLSEERLHQEAALLATRADVREELDRLAAHIEAARGLLAEGGPVGRKLDFLAQELNRETNTICSKSPHHEVTALGLELKAAVEQMREQVQNLE